MPRGTCVRASFDVSYQYHPVSALIIVFTQKPIWPDMCKFMYILILSTQLCQTPGKRPLLINRQTHQISEAVQVVIIDLYLRLVAWWHVER